MPFYNDRRLFFKRRYSAPRRWAQIVGLVAVSFLSGQVAAQYGYGNDWGLSRLASAPPQLKGNQSGEVSKDVQITLPRVSMKTRLIEHPIKAIPTDVSVVAGKKDLPTTKDVPVPVLVTSRAPSDYPDAPSEIFNDGEGIRDGQIVPVVVKSARVEHEEPSSPTATMASEEPPEQALTTVTRLDDASTKSGIRPKRPKPARVSRRSQKPSVRTVKPSIAGGQSPYQKLPKWAGRALFDTSQ